MSIYIVHRRKKTSYVLETLVLSKQAIIIYRMSQKGQQYVDDVRYVGRYGSEVLFCWHVLIVSNDNVVNCSNLWS